MESMVEADMVPNYRAQDRSCTPMVTSGDAEVHTIVNTWLYEVHFFK